MTDLILFQGEGVTLADRMKAAVQAEGLEALVKDAKAHVRTALADSVTEESERTGTQFTAKLDGWSAQWTDPDPKPSVTDREAFASWVAENDGAVEVMERVEIIDQVRAVEAVTEDESLDARMTKLLDSLKLVVEYVFPEDPFAAYAKWLHVTDSAVIDRATGEVVPGTTVTRAKPQLRLVPKGKAQRAQAKRDVADLLGIDPALTEGGGA